MITSSPLSVSVFVHVSVSEHVLEHVTVTRVPESTGKVCVVVSPVMSGGRPTHCSVNSVVLGRSGW